MKKIYFCLFFALVTFLIQNVLAMGSALKERGNDELHISVAKGISALDGVRDAAVLSHNGKTIVGIRTEDGIRTEAITLYAEKVLKKTFINNRNFKIFVGDEAAQSVVELSFYLDTDMDRQVLEKRFDFLANGI